MQLRVLPLSSAMRVLHVIGGSLSGGAARGAFWLHAALRHLGVDSRVLVQKGGGDEAVTALDDGLAGRLTQALISRLNAPHKRADTGFIFSDAWFGNRISGQPEYRRADIVHLHWINGGMLSPEGIGRLRKPLVWTLRDMWPMTGGCHYAIDCVAYRSRCGHCPALASHTRIDRSSVHQWRKKTSLPASLHLVAISAWLRECAQQSAVFRGREIDVIPNGVDLEMFKPIDRAMARSALGLPPQGKLVLAGANFLNDRYKGMHLLWQAAASVDPDVTFLFFGNVPDGYFRDFPRSFRSLGYLADSSALNLAYSAADVFVAPSTFEAFGKTLIESMASGTPVVCFDASGPRDIVSHRQDGYKAAPYEPADLARGVEWVLRQSAGELRASARKKVEERFDVRASAERYRALYERVIGEASRR